MDFPRFFRLATGCDPFPFQRRLGETGLPDKLAVPTGFGKTEAAVLAWLWRRTTCSDAEVRLATPMRLIYCLPMRVLVEQTAERVRDCVARLHAAKALIEPPEVHVLLGGAVDRAWEGQPEQPVILVGTQDQLFSRALNRGYGMSRYMWPVHFGLINNDCQWVIDEVQLMGVGASTSVQLQAFRDALGTYGASRSMWMSATLESGRLDTVDVRGRNWTEAGLDTEDHAHKVLADRWSASKSVRRSACEATDTKACAKEITQAHVAGTLTLVVVNRVARAQNLYDTLRTSKPEAAVRLLHARFRPAERRALQAEVLQAGWHGILVATQAIEAGVDLSARTLFTDLAPWSSMVQRFGRLNRRGEWKRGEASVRWFDLASTDENALLPYAVDEMNAAREIIAELKDVGPASLAHVRTATVTPMNPVLRRRDLLQMFDTEPDLAGHDLDVSQYIRSSKDIDVQVAWRTWDGVSPSDESPEPTRDELCSVGIGQLLKLIKDTDRPWRWNGLDGCWTEVGRLVPGMVVVLPVSSGGYDRELGWTGDPGDVPKPIASAAAAPDHDEAERFTFDCSRFVSLTEHACDAASEMARMRAAKCAPDIPWDNLERAARWHDQGKVHPTFQEMLTRALDLNDPRRASGPWAKSDHRGGRSARPHFRHELASALALLQNGGSDLETYLVAAHHGKVRLTLRARPGEHEPPDARLFALGVWDGDTLPAVDLGAGVGVPQTQLSLACMRIGASEYGASWLDRTSRLLGEFGPFRLSFLESLVRIADWRATKKYQTVPATEPAHA